MWWMVPSGLRMSGLRPGSMLMAQRDDADYATRSRSYIADPIRQHAAIEHAPRLLAEEIERWAMTGSET